MPRISPTFALVFTVATLIAMFVLMVTVPLDSLATPNAFIGEEIGVAAIIFVIIMVVSERVRKSSWKKSLFGFLDMRIRLPTPARIVVILFVLGCGFIFAFFAMMDDLGGYNGAASSLNVYPTLRTVYDFLGLRAVLFGTSYDRVGITSFFFFGLMLLGLFVFLSNKGIGTALKDSITLFAAPALIIFELGLWYYAPEDMTWHAVSFLWIGGINDHGYRAQSLAAGVKYFSVNNWLVLFVALFFLASRVPAFFSSPRRYGKFRRKRKE